MPHDPQRHLYENIMRDLIARIQSGELKDGERLPSEKELMQHYGVSRITATHAMQALSSDGFAVRQQGKGSFVSCPHTAHTEAEAGTPRRVGLLLPGTSDGHSTRIIEGFFSSLPYPKYEAAVWRNEARAYESYLIDTLPARGVDGLCIFPADTEIYSDSILALHMRRYPFVLIDRNFPGIQTHYVISDNQQGIALAFEHLYARGHRDIAFCAMASDQEQATGARLSAFSEMMVSHGLTMTPQMNLTDLNNDPHRAALLEDVICRHAVTAMIISNAGTLGMVTKACQKFETRVPRDLSLITFDSPECLDVGDGLCTYINQHSDRMAAVAAETLDELISGVRAPGDTMRMMLKPDLVVRDSVRNVD